MIHSGNTGVDGRYLFQVRNGQIIIPTLPDVTSTLGLLSIALLGVAAIRRRRA